MRLTFLGTGTSFGVPVIGCTCPVCGSSDPKNSRSRHALGLERTGRVLLVDTPPELRLQLLSASIERVDAVFLTHVHADHVHGIDDLRIFSMRSGRPLQMYVAAEYVEAIRKRFDYIFDDDIQPGPGTSVPEIDLRSFEAGSTLSIAGFEITPLAFPHGRVKSYGFRCGPLGVVVDGKRIPPQAQELLRGIEVLVINALWWGNPHPTHFNVEEAIAAAGQLGVSRTYLTHLTHRLDYRELSQRLPAGVYAAYDGLTVDLE